MQVIGIIIGCVLIGQVPDTSLPPLADPVHKGPADLHSLSSAEAVASPPVAGGRRNPPELAAEAIRLPEGAGLSGQPLSLLDAIGAAADRRRQTEIVHAYWGLAEALGEYRYAIEYARSLETAEGGQDAGLRSFRAAAAALCLEAELRAAEAQFELASAALMPTDAQLPLPTDPPHVGAYRTYFNELFANRTPPDAARLTDKLLPLQCRAIDQSAAAVLAAEDAFSAVSDDFRAGRGGADSLAAAARELFARRESFIRLACEYNRTIAEYSFSVAAPTTSHRQLAAMLIGPPRQEGLPRSADSRASAAAPLGNQPTLAPPRERNQPTLAPPREGWRSNEPTPAVPRDGFAPADRPRNEPTLAPRRETIEQLGYDEPVKLSPPDQPRRESPAPPDALLVPVDPPSEFSPSARAVRKPFETTLESPGGELESAAVIPRFSALRGADSAARAKQLTAAVHSDRRLPEGAGKPISLKECLLRNSGGDRLGTIASYWLLRERAARYEILAEQVEFLAALTPLVLERRNDPTGAADMLRLNAAQLAARADLGAARAEFVEAQFDLALRIGAAGETPWPLATTVPHSGEYLLKLEAQPQSLAGAWPIRRLAAVIPVRRESAWKSAEAVVEADAARAEAIEKYRTGSNTIDRVLESVAAGSEQTAAFLNSLAAYNCSIAEYATTVLPPSEPVDKLVAALIVEP